MLLKSLHLENILSFGPDGVDFEMRPLNVLIGPNGSGKSNLIDVLSLLAAAPGDIGEALRTGGGPLEWRWKGESRGEATIVGDFAEEFVGTIRYRLQLWHGFASSLRESVELVNDAGTESPVFRHEQGVPVLYTDGKRVELEPKTYRSDVSVLSQLRGPKADALFWLSYSFEQFRCYREWSFGRRTAPRLPQPADMRNDFLAEDGSNLGLVLQRLRLTPAAKDRLLEQLRRLYNGIDDYVVDVSANAVQLFLQEGRTTIPATRLSDGTLRYLCLLAILCHPEPPPLVCIEEPELGLHPDILPGLADLLRDASQRMQLVVTTHSDILVDALTDTPECVVICEKDERGTHLRRLDAEQLKPWLEKYRLGLGELWTSGELGGKRW